jgi:PAS domain S-box-containing protein
LVAANQSLRQSEAKYRALVESSPDAVVMSDLKGRITFASQRAAEQHGYGAPGELVGLMSTDLVVPADREKLRANVRRLIRQGVRRDDEYELLRRDGSSFSAEGSGAVIKDASGEPEALMAVYRDITERKQSQRALEREQRALQQMLQASDHERRLLTYEIHDGVAQQLIGAILFLQSHRQDECPAPAAENANYELALNALRAASAEVRRLMNNMRTPVLDMHGAAAAISDFINECKRRPETPEITFVNDVDLDRLAPVLENTLYRVAQEAITNACNHSASQKIRVKLVQSGEHVTIEVRDWGKGFDERSVEKMRFGLDGIRERTRVLGGELEINSSPGQGTCVRATFPLDHGER